MSNVHNLHQMFCHVFILPAILLVKKGEAVISRQRIGYHLICLHWNKNSSVCNLRMHTHLTNQAVMLF